MRILIATGIYPPEIGGPAYYAKNLADALRTKGEIVEIATFGELKALPTGIRHFALFLKMLPMMSRADVVIALDTFSAALPALFAAKIFRKKMIVRTGGDFIWEQYVERTNDLLPLPMFYEKHVPFDRKEHMYLSLTRYLLKHVTVVFSTRFQRDIWVPAYGLDGSKTHIIENAITGSFEAVAPTKKNFLFFSRTLKLRNTAKLRAAFEKAKQQIPEIELETGQVPQHILLQRIQSCYAVILPSISDISPNYILDSLRCGKPFIMTKYSEYATTFSDLGLFVDPLDENDMAEKIVALCNKKTYAGYVKKIKEKPLTRTYDELAADFQTLIRDLQ